MEVRFPHFTHSKWQNVNCDVTYEYCNTSKRSGPQTLLAPGAGFTEDNFP